MKWLKRKIHRWVKEIDYESESSVPESGSFKLNQVNRHEPESDPVLTFKIFSAENGKIIEFHSYDSKNDRFYRSNYIVGNSEDLEKTVNQCLTRELLAHGK